MNLYAESSAVLAWLLDEAKGEEVRRALSESELVITSDLTLVECACALIHAQFAGRLNEATAADRHHLLDATASRWNLLSLGEEVIERSRRPFPAQPLRALDALHLASALLARAVAPDLHLLSLDNRVRTTARALGFDLQPA